MNICVFLLRLVLLDNLVFSVYYIMVNGLLLKVVKKFCIIWLNLLYNCRNLIFVFVVKMNVEV